MDKLVDTIPIIDVDTHVTEPPDLWTSRISSKWRDLAPRAEWDGDSAEYRWRIGSRVLGGVGQASMAGWPEYIPSHPPSLEEADPACYDPNARLQRMDKYGVSANVLYSNLLGFDSHVFLEHGPEYAFECLRVYNDFLSEFASVDPERLVPLASLPFWDLDAAIGEMRRCAELGHKGIVLAAEYRLIGYPNVIEPEWAQVLAAAQELELSINFHIGFSRKAAESVRTCSIQRAAGFALSTSEWSPRDTCSTPGESQT